MVRLVDDLLVQLAGPDSPVGADRDSGPLGLFHCSMELAILRRIHVREAQVPLPVLADRFHEGIQDPDRNIEIGDRVFLGLAGDEFLDVRVVDPEDGHIRAAARSALGDFTEGFIVDSQESDRTGRLAGGGIHQRALGADPGKGKSVAAAGLLYQRRVAQGLEDSGFLAAHVVGDGKHEAGGQLPERGAGAGEGGGVWEEAQTGEEFVKRLRRFGDVAAVFGFGLRDVDRDPPEHFLNRLGRFPVGPAPEVAFFKNDPGVGRKDNRLQGRAAIPFDFRFFRDGCGMGHAVLLEENYEQKNAHRRINPLRARGC